MDNLKPAPNLTIGSVAGAISVIIIQLLQANGIVVPDSVSQALPVIVMALVSWAHDCRTGNNK